MFFVRRLLPAHFLIVRFFLAFPENTYGKTKLNGGKENECRYNEKDG